MSRMSRNNTDAPYHTSQGIRLYHGDCLHVIKGLPAESVHCVVTSPPYWNQRDYGMEGQLGLEETPSRYIDAIIRIFQEVKRVLRKDGTLWLNMGDTYGDPAGNNRSGLARPKDGGGEKIFRGRRHPKETRAKDLCGIPWRVAFALQDDGWWLRQDIIWHKPNSMPESVTDRCTKAHEYIFLMTKAAKYFYNNEAIREPSKDWGTRDRKEGSAFVDGTPGRRPQRGGRDCDFSEKGRNKRSVWTVSPNAYPGAHFATFPPKLIEPCIMAGCPEGGTVLDPFLGSGTTGAVAQKNGCKFIGIELNEEYLRMAVKRFTQKVLFQ